MTTTDAILAERGGTYGPFVDNAQIAQAIKEIYRRSPSWKKMTDVQREALDLIALKQSRILTGDPNYKDSWDDIAGYATLATKKWD